MNTLAFIPSPPASEIYLGPIPLRGYAFCIIIGVFLAVWLGGRRWVARGGRVGTVADIAVWAVPFGLVGGRLYHVITDYELYFGEGRNWVDAFKVWQGGLGIWGAVALGAVGAWIGCRRRGIPLPAYADAIAPGVVFAQAIGRWGNWFNQELYGRATDLPWAVKIDPQHRPIDSPGIATYQPCFLYECLWDIGVGFLVLWADKRFKLGHGRVLALYIAAYTAGRFWVEYLRIDDAHHILGLRLNDWTSIIVFVGAVTFFVVSHKLRPGREEIVEPLAAEEAAEAAESGKSTVDMTKDGDGVPASAAATPAGDTGPEPDAVSDDAETSSASAAAPHSKGGD